MKFCALFDFESLQQGRDRYSAVLAAGLNAIRADDSDSWPYALQRGHLLRVTSGSHIVMPELDVYLSLAGSRILTDWRRACGNSLKRSQARR